MEMSFFSSTEGYRIQKTINRSLFFKGVGLHSGVVAELTLHPAPANHGIIFEKIDISPRTKIPAYFKSVISTSMATSLGVKDHPKLTISTVEHLMAALYAVGITNVLAELKGPEIPILDGSARVFVQEILKAGVQLQPFSHQVLQVLKPIKVYKDGAICELLPRENLRLTTSVDFPHPVIGLQTCAIDLTPSSFETDIAEARTFGFQSDLEKLRSRNLAKGASLENVLAFSDNAILNPDGARFSDECVRHKLLDAIGDLALCGSWIEGELVSFRGGHSIHLTLLQSLESQPSHWRLINPTPLRTNLKREFKASQVLVPS
jgi:UDP-3-O-[3-hydroxymyristoyl] N-acetylglucosamine deacetylase